MSGHLQVHGQFTIGYTSEENVSSLVTIPIASQEGMGPCESLRQQNYTPHMLMQTQCPTTTSPNAHAYIMSQYNNPSTHMVMQTKCPTIYVHHSGRGNTIDTKEGQWNQQLKDEYTVQEKFQS